MNIQKGTKGYVRAHTDQDLGDSARRFSTLNAWKHGDYAAYQAACYQRKEKGRLDFWASITAHMRAPVDPYRPDAYTVYALVFRDHRTAYVGLTCDMDDRMRRHAAVGPVARFIAHAGQKPEITILQRVTGPTEAGKVEQYWHDHYAASGWTMLNQTRCGSTGGLSSLTKEALLDRAAAWQTRKAFLLGDQSAYRILKRRGWFEEAVAHMRPSSEVRSAARTGERRTAAAKAKMRAAKLGRRLTPEHRAKISESLKKSERYASMYR